MCLAAADFVRRFPDVSRVLLGLHNPHVTETAERILGRQPRTILTGPLYYPDFVHLMKSAVPILSDSGGVQEEAPSVGTPVLVLRDVTERPEAVETGCA